MIIKKLVLPFLFLLPLACFDGKSNSKKSKNNLSEDSEKSDQFEYPETFKGDVVETYFGKEVADPYRWLEDDRSPETSTWVEKQNEVTFKYLEKIKIRNTIKDRLEKIWNYEKIGAPFKKGKHSYYFKNDGLQNQSVVYRQNDSGKDEIFLNPNTFSADGTTSLDQLSFSKSGEIAAYSISEGGSDWRKIIMINAESKLEIDSPLQNIKFSDISWKGDEGFYYSSYAKPDGSVLSAKTDQHILYFHKLGQAQEDDQIIFGAHEEQKRRYVSANVTDDDHFLIIRGANSTSGNDLYVKDLSNPSSELVTILDHQDSDTWLIDNEGNKFYLVTNLNAPNNKIVSVDFSDPKPENWQDFIPETENVLIPTVGGGYFFTEYMVDAISKVYQYDYLGNKIRELKLPGLGSTSTLSGKKSDKTLYYSFSNYMMPSTLFSFDIEKGQSSLYRKSGADFKSDDFVSKQVFYNSKDGTKVPMIITHKKGLELNGKNPTILYGYGGFNISLTPQFSLANSVWMELGGVYAVPNIRGGGEYGENWHKAGTQLNKQNVFDDFIAAGEYLISQNYTSKDYLAIRGGSNGGLLVGAVMTQRPDLMKVAIPEVGVLDMLRYHKFTSGAGWASDYGTSEQSKEMFEYLYAYSPVHNVKQGMNYPATLILTGDHDDRVVPAHSFKFAAELQDKQSGNAPVLIRIETDAGHGAGTPVSKTIDKYADMFGFIFQNMGIDLPSE